MSVSLHEASVPVFTQYLGSLGGTLAKAKAYAAGRKIDDAVLCQARLFPDMLPLVKQVQTACDFAKNGTSRLAGLEPPRWSDDEATFDELEGRVARTIAYLKTVPRESLDAGTDRSITITAGKETLNFVGKAYLLHFVLPNFFFHATTAYAILRENGVELSKRDFIGTLPG